MAQNNQYGAVNIRIKDADRPTILPKRCFNRCHVRALQALYPVGQPLPGEPEGITFNNQIPIKGIDPGSLPRVYDQLVADCSDTDVPDAQRSIQVNIAGITPLPPVNVDDSGSPTLLDG